MQFNAAVSVELSMHDKKTTGILGGFREENLEASWGAHDCNFGETFIWC
jgi:hypothetical protein